MPVITLTAIIHAKRDSAALIRASLLDVAHYAQNEEPGTIAYFVTESEESGVFVTHERYRNRAAMEAHNEGPGAKGFFKAAGAAVDKVDIVIGEEIAN